MLHAVYALPEHLHASFLPMLIACYPAPCFNNANSCCPAPFFTLLAHAILAPVLQTHLRDFMVWLVAFVCTLFLGIELGLAMAIGLAILIVVFESAFPHTAVLGRVDRTTVRVVYCLLLHTQAYLEACRHTAVEEATVACALFNVRLCKQAAVACPGSLMYTPRM
jgi:hypothetical protein